MLRNLTSEEPGDAPPRLTPRRRRSPRLPHRLQRELDRRPRRPRGARPGLGGGGDGRREQSPRRAPPAHAPAAPISEPRRPRAPARCRPGRLGPPPRRSASPGPEGVGSLPRAGVGRAEPPRKTRGGEGRRRGPGPEALTSTLPPHLGTASERLRNLYFAESPLGCDRLLWSQTTLQASCGLGSGGKPGPGPCVPRTPVRTSGPWGP